MRDFKVNRKEMASEVAGWVYMTWSAIKTSCMRAQREWIPTDVWRKLPSWDREGLEGLLKKTINGLSFRNYIPYNISMQYPTYGETRGKRVDCMEIPEQMFRLNGWLLAVERFPLLGKFIRKTQSSRGVNSPYTTCDLVKVAQRHPSPGAFVHWLIKVRKRADQILKPYGMNCSWAGLAKAAECSSHRIGKAAKFAAAETLKRHNKVFGYYDLWKLNPTETLIKFRGFRDFQVTHDCIKSFVLDMMDQKIVSTFREGLEMSKTMSFHTDESGIIVLYDPNSEFERHGLRAYRAWMLHRVWLVIDGTGRSFHQGRPMIWDQDIRVEQPVDFRAAIAAWKKQDAEIASLQGLFPSDRTILISREDSYAAGNCPTGTEQFLKTEGLSARNFVAAKQLLSYADRYSAVRRVLSHVSRQLVA